MSLTSLIGLILHNTFAPGGCGAGVCHLWIIIIIINTWVKRDGVGLRAVWFGNWVGVWV